MPPAATTLPSASSAFRPSSRQDQRPDHRGGTDRGASQSVKGGGKLYIRIFPHKSVTSIPAETRMGKGKGEVEFWAAVVKPGTVLFELGGVSEESPESTFARVAYKLPVRCRFVGRRPTL